MLVKKLFQMANVSLKRRFVIFLKVLLGTLIASLALLLIFCTIGMWQDTPFITGAVMISFFVLLCTGGSAILLFLLVSVLLIADYIKERGTAQFLKLFLLMLVCSAAVLVTVNLLRGAVVKWYIVAIAAIAAALAAFSLYRGKIVRKKLEHQCSTVASEQKSL